MNEWWTNKDSLDILYIVYICTFVFGYGSFPNILCTHSIDQIVVEWCRAATITGICVEFKLFIIYYKLKRPSSENDLLLAFVSFVLMKTLINKKKIALFLTRYRFISCAFYIGHE